MDPSTLQFIIKWHVWPQAAAGLASIVHNCMRKFSRSGCNKHDVKPLEDLAVGRLSYIVMDGVFFCAYKNVLPVCKGMNDSLSLSVNCSYLMDVVVDKKHNWSFSVKKGIIGKE
jgi:hypothetical protein